jgi:hypothetical protein
MGRFERVAFDGLALRLGVKGVQVQAVCAGAEGQDGLEVLPHLVAVARPARMVARRQDAAAPAGVQLLKAIDIVGLPAVKRQRHPQRGLHSRGDVHPQGCVTLLRVGVKAVGGLSRDLRWVAHVSPPMGS